MSFKSSRTLRNISRLRKGEKKRSMGKKLAK